MSPVGHHRVTKIGNEPKFSEMPSDRSFSNEIGQLPGLVQHFDGTENSEGKLDGVAGFEPADDRIKICCLAA